MLFLKRGLPFVGKPLSAVLVVLIGITAILGCTKKKKNYLPLFALALAPVSTNAGTGTGTNTAVSTFSIGGTITGLTASGLVLQNNAGDNLTAASGATTFTFATKVNTGAAYAVTVKTQPAESTCTVSSGSGNASANITNVNVSCASNCAGSTLTRNWGTFTDCNNGTVKLAVNAGTFGGQTYAAQTLTWMKCTYGNTYDSGGNTCTGTATTGTFCSTQTNACNDGTTLNGSGTSGAYTACNSLNATAVYGKTNWRVPTKNELKLLVKCTSDTEMVNDASACSSYTSPTTHTSLFPNTGAIYYWSSTTSTLTTAWTINFDTSDVIASVKNYSGHLRCVSGP